MFTEITALQLSEILFIKLHLVFINGFPIALILPCCTLWIAGLLLIHVIYYVLHCQTNCILYSGSSPNGRTHEQTALLTAAFAKPRFSQLPLTCKLCILAPVTVTILVSWGCPLMSASTVLGDNYYSQLSL